MSLLTLNRVPDGSQNPRMGYLQRAPITADKEVETGNGLENQGLIPRVSVPIFLSASESAVVGGIGGPNCLFYTWHPQGLVGVKDISFSTTCRTVAKFEPVRLAYPAAIPAVRAVAGDVPVMTQVLP